MLHHISMNKDNCRVFLSTSSGWCLEVPVLKVLENCILTETSFRAQDTAIFSWAAIILAWILWDTASETAELKSYANEFTILISSHCTPNSQVSVVSFRAHGMLCAISSLSEWTQEHFLVPKSGVWVSIGGICHDDIELGDWPHYPCKLSLNFWWVSSEMEDPVK